MDEQKKPRSRVKKVVNEGGGVEKKGEGLGTGPVNNAGNYEDRKQQAAGQAANSAGAPRQQSVNSSPFGQSRPQSGSFNPSGQLGPQSGNSGPFGQSRPQPGNSGPFGQNRPQGAGPASFGQSGSQQGQRETGILYGHGARPAQNQASSGQKQYNSAVKQSGTGGGQRASGSGYGGGQRATGSGSGGGGGKLILIVIALVVLLGGGKLSGLFGGGNDNGGVESVLNTVTQSDGNDSNTSSSGGNGLDISNLLSSFMGSSGTSAYDLSSLLGGISSSASSGTGALESLLATQSTQASYPSTAENTAGKPDESVSKKARNKYTTIRGNNKDEITILVYMCGTDLESQQGMATSDLKEMANATIGKNVNLIIYTGGCSRWRNNVISSQTNQIYRISNGKFECLEKDAGNRSMVNPDTLVSFVEYGTKNFPANRMCLIFWDHGGGSVSGYGYDEKVGHNQSMTLAGINSALKKADVKFDFIGFDACLMATVENGLMLSQYADYMIASEETEPGVGWYYTNWLTKLSDNTSMPTIQIGKMIADDFVTVCERQCRGQGTTLSVVDLAELQATIPGELKEFSVETNGLIQNKEYKKISTARSKTREFAQQSKIDQIDLVDFAKNMGTAESGSLADALQSSVKYNRTGGGISHAYGLSIYFPYKRANKVSQMVSTYQAIGMEEEYTRCIQEFASLEVSGQVSAGTPVTGYGSNQNASSGLLGSLLGTGGGYNTSYSAGGLEELLGGLYGSGGSGSGSTGSILDLFMGRSMTAENAAEYILENHFDAAALTWDNGRINLSASDWAMTESLVKNVFVDDGSGFIDLGCDAQFETEGNALKDDFDGTWLALNGHIMPYYYLNTVEYDNDEFVMYGYAPAILNGTRVNLMIDFVNGEEAMIAGAQYVYADRESDTQGKLMIAIGEGDQIQFICDYYDYDGNYRDSYKLGDPFTLGTECEIVNRPIDRECKVTYCFTDYYQQRYWTPALQWKEQ